MRVRRPVVAALCLLCGSPGNLPGQRADETPRYAGTDELVLDVPASTRLDDPLLVPVTLQPGDRLVIDAQGDVRGAEPDTSGGIPAGALVGTFNGSPMFLLGTRRLVWAAPADGRLELAVAQREFGELSGGYSVRVVELGRRGDSRQRRFAAPEIAFAPRFERGDFLLVRYRDRAGFGLDRKSLRVVLEANGGRRWVISPHFEVRADAAALRRLPAELRVPPGVHRVTATITDGLGNISPPAEVFVDVP